MSQRKRFKVEHGFKLSRRNDEDPLDTSQVPLRKRNQKGSSNSGKKRQNITHNINDSTEINNSYATDFETELDGHEHNEISDEKIACELSALEIYEQLLKCGQIHVIDETLTSFVVPDFEEKQSKLKVDSFCIVSRYPKSFAGEDHWVYVCCCDADRKKMLESLNDRVITSFQEFSSAFEPCIHCKAVNSIVNGVDGLYDISPEIYADHDYTNKKKIELEVKDLFPLGKDTICVKASQNPGIVKFSNSFLTCSTCESSSCVHTGVVGDLIRDIVNEENLENQPDEVLEWLLSHAEGKKTSVTYKPRVVSWKKIPFHYPDELCDLLQKPSDQRFHNWQCNLDKPDKCDACHNESFDQHCRTIDVISDSFIHPFKVNTWKCSQCDLDISFDGQEYGVINMGNYCITYEVLRRFLFYFLQGKSTMYTEFIVLRQMLLDHGLTQVDSHFSYQKLQHAWYAFIDLLDIDFNQGFICPECGPEPSISVMDATTLSFRKRMISWDILFKDVEKQKQMPSKGSSHRHQVFIENTVLRKDLKKFARLGMDQDEFYKLLEQVKREEGHLYNLLIQIKEENKNRKKVSCCKELKKLLWSLSCDTPACGILLPTEENKNLFKDLSKITSDVLLMRQLQESFPILFDILHAHGHQYTKSLGPVLQQLILRAELPFQENLDNLNIDFQSTSEESKDSLAYYPNMSVKRDRGLYDLDMGKVRQTTCRKRTHGHPTLLPGLFTILCPHGVCYGFEVMTVAESPNVPFTVLKTRFSKAPDVVIYDNACNLHRYCLNRDPKFFQNTQFKVDGLHWDNHLGCSSTYELKSYPQFRDLNSQVVEQFNSQIKKLKGMISYMTKDNFFKHLKLFVWGKNNNVVKKN